MSFSCSRCSRDFFKICKILLDVDTCDECIKLKKPCDVFIFETICESRLSLLVWSLTFSKKRLEDEKIKFHVEIENTFVEYFVKNQEIQSLYSSQKEIRDDLFAREFNLRRLLSKQRRLVQCFKTFEKKEDNLVVQKQRMLSRFDEIDDFVVFHSIEMYESITQETFIESISLMSFEKMNEFLREFDFFMLVKLSSF